MGNELIENYLEKSKNFWNVPEVEIAMYRRICTDFSKEFKDLDFDEQFKNWNISTARDLKIIFNNIPSQPDWKILDIGCGIGRLIKPLRDIYKQVDGVDISEKMIEFSKKYLSEVQSKGNTYVNDGMSLTDLEDNYYDFVYSMITFQHIRSYKIVKNYLSEILRVLKPDGYLRLQVHKPYGKYGKYNEEGEPDKDYYFNGNAYTSEEFKFVLEEAGFNVIEITDDPDEKLWLWSTSKKTA